MVFRLIKGVWTFEGRCPSVEMWNPYYRFSEGLWYSTERHHIGVYKLVCPD